MDPEGGLSTILRIPSNGRSFSIAAGALLVLATILGYANSVDVPFVFDDMHAIVQNREIHDWDRFVRSSWLRRPRALVDLTFAFQWHLHGNRVLPYHLVNIGLHAVSGVLAYLLSGLLFQTLADRQAGQWWSPNPQRAAFWAAAFFTVHPIQTEAVTYIVQRYTAMAALFYLGAVLCYIQMRRTNRPVYGVWVAALALAAFQCKQNALTLPLVLIGIEWLVLKRHARFWRAAAGRLALPMAAMGIAVLWHLGLANNSWSLTDLLSDVDRATRETAMVPRTSYFYTQLRVLCLYGLLMVAPLRQSVDHGYPFVHQFLAGWTPFAALVLGALAAVGWSVRRRLPMVSFGIFWFFTTLSLESSIFPIKDAMVEHRLYLPVLGLGWIVATGLEWTQGRYRRLGVLLGLSLLALLLSATILRNQLWRDPVLLWRNALDQNPTHYRAANNLGRYLLDAGRHDEAEQILLQARALNPLKPNVHFNLGLLYARQGRWPQAAEAFQTAILLEPSKAGFHYNWAMAVQRMDRFPEAQRGYEAAWILDPAMEEAVFNLAALHFQNRHWVEARDILEAAAQSHPSSFRVYTLLSKVYQAMGLTEAARRAVEHALSLNPEDRGALLQKAFLLASSGSLDEALSILVPLKARYPQDEQVAFLLDNVRDLLGKP